MNKKEFVDAIWNIEDVMIWIETIESQGVRVLDTSPIFKLVDSYVETLEKVMKDEAGFIGWYCFDLDFGNNDNGVIWVNDKEYIISNVDDLYDYLIMEENKND